MNSSFTESAVEDAALAWFSDLAMPWGTGRRWLPVRCLRNESARAKIRVMVKRVLNKHGYLPDLQEGTVKTLLMQAELLCAGNCLPGIASRSRRFQNGPRHSRESGNPLRYFPHITVFLDSRFRGNDDQRSLCQLLDLPASYLRGLGGRMGGAVRDQGKRI